MIEPTVDYMFGFMWICLVVNSLFFILVVYSLTPFNIIILHMTMCAILKIKVEKSHRTRLAYMTLYNNYYYGRV